MEAISRFHAQMAKNYILTNERAKCAASITECISELNKDLDAVINSIRSNGIQENLIRELESPTTQEKTHELKTNIDHYILKEQENTLFDINSEKSLVFLKRLLRNKMIDQAVRKIQNVIKYNDSFEYMISIEQEEIQSIYDHLVANRNTDNNAFLIYHVQKLH